MNTGFFKSCLFNFLFAFPCIVMGQNIVIDDSLAAHADMYKVKVGGSGFGKVVKISFGDYAVTSSKSGWRKTNSSANLLETKKETKTTHKFSLYSAINPELLLLSMHQRISWING